MSIGTALTGGAWVFVIAARLLAARDDSRSAQCAAWAVAAWLQFANFVRTGSLGWAVWSGSLAVFFTYLWWRNRPRGRGRKALRELGAKSRARVQALVEQMTPSPIPSRAGAS